MTTNTLRFNFSRENVIISAPADIIQVTTSLITFRYPVAGWTAVLDKPYIAKIGFTVTNFACNIELITQLMLSINRLTAICYPMKHSRDAGYFAVDGKVVPYLINEKDQELNSYISSAIYTFFCMSCFSLNAAALLRHSQQRTLKVFDQQFAMARRLQLNLLVYSFAFTLAIISMAVCQVSDDSRTAKLLEDTVRNEGSEPATIALLDGRIHVGLSSEQLVRIAESQAAVKVSRRDIVHALNKGLIGGTTVAATMYLAHMVGIRVFATGGIGGVHRGVDQTLDISADLIELMRTPVTVVCAGVKSILDIPKTVEFLETHSINCIVFGKQNVFPGFFTRETQAKGQYCTEDLTDVVKCIEMSATLGLEAGTVLACPIPDALESDGKTIENAIQVALEEARTNNTTSKDVTPFLLSRVNELTAGESMRINIGLLENNARVGGRLARLLSGSKSPLIVRAREKRHQETTAKKRPKIVVVGATIIDIEAITNENVKDDGGSYVGELRRRCGGVGRNHADALARLGCDVSFISAVGDDQEGRYFLDRCTHIDTSNVEVVKDLPTATYMSVNVSGEVRFGISCIGDIVKRISPELISSHEELIPSADFILFDGNITSRAIERIVELSTFYKKKAWFEPTDIAKLSKIFEFDGMERIHVISPNANEFRQMVQRSGLEIPANLLVSPCQVCDFVLSHPKIMYNLDMLIVSLSSHGTAIIFRKPDGSISASHFPAPLITEKVVSVSGAGDSLNSGILAGLVHRLPLEKCFQIGQACAALSLQTVEAISPDINPALLSM
ncbi:Pseudouridine-metabolizing bifunctional protein [Trichostrongylus colubriformis]|uniref:Pseudouridine-metabolizing bifunctional protein n=1 Tax=Trichostrongylus colubriformis TaxID=6319 RepID=A0AAN8G638_TRICO